MVPQSNCVCFLSLSCSVMPLLWAEASVANAMKCETGATGRANRPLGPVSQRQCFWEDGAAAMPSRSLSLPFFHGLYTRTQSVQQGPSTMVTENSGADRWRSRSLKPSRRRSFPGSVPPLLIKVRRVLSRCAIFSHRQPMHVCCRIPTPRVDVSPLQPYGEKYR
jgi:hypothetical protein